MMEDRPIYNITIDPEFQEGENELGWDETAFTSEPAVMVKGMAYKSNTKKQIFADKKKYRVTAPAMIPMDIYRSDEDGDYDVRFTEQTIEDLHKKFMSNLDNKDKFNMEHDGVDRVPAYMLECWLVDNPKQDKAFSTFGIEVPKGTLMFTVQFTNVEFYNEIVKNEQIGLSIEGFLGLSINKEQLNKYKQMELPNGNFTIEGKNYTVLNGEIKLAEEVKEEEEVEMEEEVIEEEEVKAESEEVIEEEVEAEEVIEEEVVEEVEAEINPEADADAILAIVNPIIDEKINEVLELIAEVRNELSELGVAPTEDVEVQMSKNEGFKRFTKAFKN